MTRYWRWSGKEHSVRALEESRLQTDCGIMVDESVCATAALGPQESATLRYLHQIRRSDRCEGCCRAAEARARKAG